MMNWTELVDEAECLLFIYNLTYKEINVTQSSVPFTELFLAVTPKMSFGLYPGPRNLRKSNKSNNRTMGYTAVELRPIFV
jgi:hypothetical protein